MRDIDLSHLIGLLAAGATFAECAAELRCGIEAVTGAMRRAGIVRTTTPDGVVVITYAKKAHA